MKYKLSGRNAATGQNDGSFCRFFQLRQPQDYLVLIVMLKHWTKILILRLNFVILEVVFLPLQQLFSRKMRVFVPWFPISLNMTLLDRPCNIGPGLQFLLFLCLCNVLISD